MGRQEGVSEVILWPQRDGVGGRGQRLFHDPRDMGENVSEVVLPL